MYKIILWDIDGVIIRHKSYFSEKLIIDGYNDPINILNEFRTTKLNELCDKGELDPLIAIKPFLKRIGWEYTCEEYFNAQYEYEDKYIDDKLLMKISHLRESGIRNYIATNQNYYRMNHLRKRLNVNSNFDGLFVSNKLNAVKKEDEYWRKILEEISNENKYIELKNIIFVDDMKENVKKANENGIPGIVIINEYDIGNILQKIEEKFLTTAST